MKIWISGHVEANVGNSFRKTMNSVEDTVNQMLAKDSYGNKTSVNVATGEVTNETGGKVKTSIDGVPTTIGLSTTSGSGQTVLNAQVAAGPSKAQAMGEAKYSNKGGQQSISVGLGVQATAGKTTYQTSFGFNFFW